MAFFFLDTAHLARPASSGRATGEEGEAPAATSDGETKMARVGKRRYPWQEEESSDW